MKSRLSSDGWYSIIPGVSITEKNRIDPETRSTHGKEKKQQKKQYNNQNIQRGECGMVCKNINAPFRSQIHVQKE